MGGARDARDDHRETEHVLHVGSVLYAGQTRGREGWVHFLRSVGGMETGNADAAMMTKLWNGNNTQKKGWRIWSRGRVSSIGSDGGEWKEQKEENAALIITIFKEQMREMNGRQQGSVFLGCYILTNWVEHLNRK